MSDFYEMKARAALGQPASDPVCDCITRYPRFWHTKCYCGNRDDASYAADWCALENTVENVAEALKQISSNIQVRAKKDGTWITFTASDGKSATLRIETVAKGKIGIIGMALRQWCEDQQELEAIDRIAEEDKKEEEINAGQFGVGA